MEVLDTPNYYTPPRQTDQVVSVGEWVLVLFILAIPVINIIMLFVWGFGSSTNRTKANFCKASLIWMAITVVIFFVMLFMGALAVFSGMMMHH